MTNRLARLSILLFLGVMALPQPVRSADYVALRPQSVLLTPETVLERYIQTNPTLADDPRFVESYAGYKKCADYTAAAKTPASKSDFLATVKAEIESIAKKPLAPYYTTVIDAALGDYDAASGVLVFKPFETSTQFPISFTSIETAGTACRHMYERFPHLVYVKIANPAMIEDIPMDAPKAQELLQARATLPPSEQRKVGLEMILSLKDWNAVQGTGAQKSLPPIRYVMAEVKAAAVNNGAAEKPQIIIPLGDDYFAARKTLAEKQAQEKQAQEKILAEKKAQTSALDAARLATWFFKLKSQPVPAEFGLPAAATADKTLRVDNIAFIKIQPGNKQGGLMLKQKSVGFSYPGKEKISLEFTNENDFKNITLDPGFSKAVGTKMPEQTRVAINAALVVTPVGIHEDPANKVKIVKAHITRLEVAAQTRASETADWTLYNWDVAATSQPTPYTQKWDTRPSSTFDIMGIKIGMKLKDVQAQAEKALGHKLTFNEATRTLVSPRQFCVIEYRTIVRAFYGNKCFRASFMQTGKNVLGGGQYTLVRVSLMQTDEAAKINALRAQYLKSFGTPERATAAISISSLDAADLAAPLKASFLSWGAQIMNSRFDLSAIKNPDAEGYVPVHVLEYEQTSGVGGSTGKLTLTGEDFPKAFNLQP